MRKASTCRSIKLALLATLRGWLHLFCKPCDGPGTETKTISGIHFIKTQVSICIWNMTSVSSVFITVRNLKNIFSVLQFFGSWVSTRTQPWGINHLWKIKKSREIVFDLTRHLFISLASQHKSFCGKEFSIPTLQSLYIKHLTERHKAERIWNRKNWNFGWDQIVYIWKGGTIFLENEIFFWNCHNYNKQWFDCKYFWKRLHFSAKFSWFLQILFVWKWK